MKYAVLGAALLIAGNASAALLVTEFLPDPSGTDADREWFEIYNSGSIAIDLTGYAAGDGTSPTGMSTGEGMGVFPVGATINPGQVLVITANALGFNSLYGFLPDFEFANSTSILGNEPTVPDLTQKLDWGVPTATLAIANGGDDVGILTPGSTAASFTFVDGGNHGTVTTFYSGAVLLSGNQSYERVPANQDTDTVNEWTVRTTNTATPGVVTIPEPASLSLLLFASVIWFRARRR